MCGRYTLTVTLDELMAYYWVDAVSIPYHQPRYNVAPGQMIMAVIHDGTQNRIGELKWGLIPSWAKDEKGAGRMINARAETLSEKPAYRIPFMRKRCLIPADGFYEWKKTDRGKQPMRIVLKGGGIFSFAGLYDTWIAPDGRKISTCTIVTTEPNRLMVDIHDRMPVILTGEDEHRWLDRNIRDPEILKPLLKPYPAEQMTAYPVTPAVGNAKLDLPDFILEWTGRA